MSSGSESEEWEGPYPRQPYPPKDQLEEAYRLFDEEWGKDQGFDVDLSKHCQGFDVDLSKLSYTFGAGSVDLEDDNMASELENGRNNRDLMNELSKMAISYYNKTTGTNIELVDVLRANYHPSAALTYYITFRANDPSDGIQPKEFQAKVRYLRLYDSEAFYCVPRPC